MSGFIKVASSKNQNTRNLLGNMKYLKTMNYKATLVGATLLKKQKDCALKMNVLIMYCLFNGT